MFRRGGLLGSTCQQAPNSRTGEEHSFGCVGGFKSSIVWRNHVQEDARSGPPPYPVVAHHISVPQRLGGRYQDRRRAQDAEHALLADPRQGHQGYRRRKNNVELILLGPPTEDAVEQQINMVQDAISQKPDARDLRAVAAGRRRQRSGESQGGQHSGAAWSTPACPRASRTIRPTSAPTTSRPARLGGEALAKLLKKGDKVLLLDGTPGNPSMNRRIDGAAEVLEAAGMVIASRLPAFSDREKAYSGDPGGAPVQSGHRRRVLRQRRTGARLHAGPEAGGQERSGDRRRRRDNDAIKAIHGRRHVRHHRPGQLPDGPDRVR